MFKEDVIYEFFLKEEWDSKVSIHTSTSSANVKGQRERKSSVS